MTVYLADRAVHTICTALSMGSSVDTAGAWAQCDLISVPNDYFSAKINPRCGDSLRIERDGTVLFSGTVERVSAVGESGVVTVRAYDTAALLAKNEVYALLSGSPSGIMAKALALSGIPQGELYGGEGSFALAPSTGMTVFDIFRAVYADTAFTYTDQNGAVAVGRRGEHSFELREDLLLGVSSDYDGQAMVNSSEVIGYMGARLASAQNQSDMLQLGKRHRIYTLNGAKSTAQRTANSALSGVVDSAVIVTTGLPHALVGAAVTVDKPIYGLSGRYICSAVKHLVRSGIFLTETELIRA